MVARSLAVAGAPGKQLEEHWIDGGLWQRSSPARPPPSNAFKNTLTTPPRDETEEPVHKEDITRGYEVGKREYIEVEDEELEKIQIESTHTIDIDRFVPRDEIDNRYLNAPYYIVPKDKVGQEAFAVIRDAIAAKGRVALARVVLTRRSAKGFWR